MPQPDGVLDPPLLPPSPLAIQGDVTMAAGTNVTIVTGLTPGVFAPVVGPVFFGQDAVPAATPFFMTAAESTAILNQFTPTLQGLVPLSGGGTANFLRADGTWAPLVSADVLTASEGLQRVGDDFQIIDGGVTLAKLADITTHSIIIGTPATPAPVTEVIPSNGVAARFGGGNIAGEQAVDGDVLRFTAGALGFGSLVTNNIGDDQITNGLLAEAPADTFKANATVGTANPTDHPFVTLAGTGLDYAGGGVINVNFASVTYTASDGVELIGNDFQIIDGGVTLAKLADITTHSIIIGTPATPAPVTEVIPSNGIAARFGGGNIAGQQASAGDVLRFAAGGLNFGTLLTENFGDNQVTNAKADNMGANTFKGNVTGVTSDPTDNSLNTLFGDGLDYAAGVARATGALIRTSLESEFDAAGVAGTFNLQSATRKVVIEIKGAGGGGAGCNATPDKGAAGGGEGGYVYFSVAVSGGNALGYVIGVGGAGGSTAPGDGTTGGTTAIVVNGNEYDGSGGVGGLQAQGATGEGFGGAGGINTGSSVGLIRTVRGAPGENIPTLSDAANAQRSGGGGGSGAGKGNITASGNSGVGFDAQDGSGAGGGGAFNDGIGAVVGGDGGDGYITIFEYS